MIEGGVEPGRPRFLRKAVIFWVRTRAGSSLRNFALSTSGRERERETNSFSLVDSKDWYLRATKSRRVWRVKVSKFCDGGKSRAKSW